MTGDMTVEELRAAVGPGGHLEFTHAGGTVEVPVSPPGFEARVTGMIYNACQYNRPALLQALCGDGVTREGVLIARHRYEELVAKARLFDASGQRLTPEDVRR